MARQYLGPRGGLVGNAGLNAPVPVVGIKSKRASVYRELYHVGGGVDMPHPVGYWTVGQYQITSGGYRVLPGHVKGRLGPINCGLCSFFVGLPLGLLSLCFLEVFQDYSFVFVKFFQKNVKRRGFNLLLFAILKLLLVSKGVFQGL